MCLPTRPAALSACLLLVSVPAGATAQDQGDSDTPDDVTYGIDNAQSDEGLKVVEGGTKEKDSTDGSDDSAGRSGDEASNPEASGSSKSTSTDLNIEHHEKTPESLEAGATGEVSAEENSSADSGGDGPRSRIRRLVEE
ncbi:MAG: hypothetical protein ABEL76_00825, partial [Bradymonadaceae bacterium]